MRKIPTLFVRDFERDNGRYVTEEVTPGCEWVLAGEGVPTRKYDGTCIRVQNGPVYALWARREVKAGKTPPPGFEPIETDATTGKTVGWEPWSQSSFAEFIEEARQSWADAHPRPDPHLSDLPSGTYELVGPKINGNPERRERHELIPHAHAERIIMQKPLTFGVIRRDVVTLARDDPARVLAEVEAKRRIVELHSHVRNDCWEMHRGVYGPGWPEGSYAVEGQPWAHPALELRDGPCETLQLLALPYADHEHYRQEWRP